MPCGSNASTNFTRECHDVRRLSWLPRGFAWLAVLFDNTRRRQILLELEKAKQRGILKDLDERMLKDIGLTRAQALREARKPFWSSLFRKAKHRDDAR
jgi:uncharacterized protein YjiS (DUF1127 family)